MRSAGDRFICDIDPAEVAGLLAQFVTPPVP